MEQDQTRTEITPEETVCVFQSYYNENLSLEDVEEMRRNMIEFFEFLRELEEKYGKEEKNL